MRWLQADCSEGIQKFIATVSSVLCLKLPGFEYMFTNILVKKCLPILFYGMDCCILNSVMLRSLSQAWNMPFKWLFNHRKCDST